MLWPWFVLFCVIFIGNFNIYDRRINNHLRNALCLFRPLYNKYKLRWSMSGAGAGRSQSENWTESGRYRNRSSGERIFRRSRSAHVLYYNLAHNRHIYRTLMGYLVLCNTFDVSRSDIHYQRSLHAFDAIYSLVVLPYLTRIRNNLLCPTKTQNRRNFLPSGQLWRPSLSAQVKVHCGPRARTERKAGVTEIGLAVSGYFAARAPLTCSTTI